MELGYRPFTELAANTFLIPNFKLKTVTDPGRVIEIKNKVLNYICPIFWFAAQTFNGGYERKMNTDKR